MIMQRLRRVTKYFMWVVAVVFILFIFFGFGANIMSRGEEGKSNLIAEVEGVGIGYREYSNLLNSQLNLISGSIGINPLKERELSDQIINRLIMEKIMENQMDKRDISISDAQVIEIIKNSPPREIFQDSTFWIGGQFDYSRYYELLKNPRASQFINDYARRVKSDLPQRILGGEVSSLARLTHNEFMEDFLDDSVSIKLEYIRIPLDEWIKDEPSGSAEEFYSFHKDLFIRDGVVSLGYVSFPVEVDEEMEHSIKELAFSITKRAENVDFDTLISIYSYLPRNRQLINGWIPVDGLPSVFTSALLGMKIGEIGEPIRSDEGYHILKLTGRERNRLCLKEIFLPVFPSTEKYTDAMMEAWSLVKILRSDTTGLNSVDSRIPDTYEVEHITYGIGYIPDLGVEFGTLLDDPKRGEISYPLVGVDSIYVFWVEDVEKGIPPFPLIKDEVVDSIRSYEAGEQAKKYVRENFPDKVLMRHPQKGSWHRTPYFSRNNYRGKGIDLPDKIVDLAMNLKEGMVSPGLRAGRALYLLKVTGREAPSADEIKKILPGFMNQMQMVKQATFYQGWLYEQRKGSKIYDWRSKLYE